MNLKTAAKLFPFVFIGFVTCLIFFKIFLYGLFPVPGDLLVSFYFPWYSGGWDGYNPWTVHKELLNADAIRQIYLWKELAADQFKTGHIPLWNPYTFSGQPLAANFQSSVFYPLNALYFLFNAKDAWILLVVSQPLLAGVFMYVFLRSIKLSSIASLYGSVVLMFSSYLITWLENGNIIHSYLWLPLIFFGTSKLYIVGKFKYLALIIFSLTLAVLAGHPQTAIYIYAAFVLFWIYNAFKIRKKPDIKIKTLSFILILSLALSAIQWIPTVSLYLQSPISLPFSKEVFDKFLIPYTNLVTFLAPDFFGHPATDNFWSFTYGDFTPYIGVIPLILAVYGFSNFRKNPFVVFCFIVGSIFLLASVSSPISFLVKILKLPILDSTSSARFTSITLFLLSIVSAFGFGSLIDNLRNKKLHRKFFVIIIIFGAIYLILWLFTIFGFLFLDPKDLWQSRLKVTQRNLILPSGLFLFFALSFVFYFFSLRINKLAKLNWGNLMILVIFFGTIFGGLYFSNKFLPVAPKKFIFPEHPVFDYLSDNAGISRFFGFGTAHVDFNFPSVYRVYGVEGYDTLRIERYAQLMASSFTGYVPANYLRSDAVLPTEENGYRKRLLDLLGVAYFLDKEDNPKSNADWHYERFPGDSVLGVWQSGKTQIYRRKDALPRVFLSTNYEVVKSDSEIIGKIYDSGYDLRTIILEEEPKLKIGRQDKSGVSPFLEIEGMDSEVIQPAIIKYEPGTVILKADVPVNSLLFISDVYDKDWKAYVDGKPQAMLRAHYAFRAVEVPSGKHDIKFVYSPSAFKLGLTVSGLAIIVFIFTGFILSGKTPAFILGMKAESSEKENTQVSSLGKFIFWKKERK